MKQKLALACTLVHEPTDSARRADDRRRSRLAPRILEAALGVPRHGITIVMSTPYLDEAERLHRVRARVQGRARARRRRTGTTAEAHSRPDASRSSFTGKPADGRHAACALSRRDANAQAVGDVASTITDWRQMRSKAGARSDLPPALREALTNIRMYPSLRSRAFGAGPLSKTSSM
jgi:hypothetical protein